MPLSKAFKLFLLNLKEARLKQLVVNQESQDAYGESAARTGELY